MLDQNETYTLKPTVYILLGLTYSQFYAKKYGR